MYKYCLLIAAALLVGCGGYEGINVKTESDEAKTVEAGGGSSSHSEDVLAQILEDQAESVHARYSYRHPRETLEFFGVKPGMTVVEVLPGRGWYSKILLPYLGDSGSLIGADYNRAMFPLFGVFSDEWIKAKETWVEDWTADASAWRGESQVSVDAFVLETLPDSMKESADAVVVVRALHNLARFSDKRDFLAPALQDFYDVLKPGGVVGVVQHQARPEMPDTWASGKNGYLKKAFVIAQFEKAGFEYQGESGINHNHRDQPTTSDFVWRLPPSYRTSKGDPALKAQFDAIGESHRMTLKFRKPS